MKPRSALLLLLDRPQWSWARAISYTATFGIEEGLRAQGIESTVVPTFLELNSQSELSWLFSLRRLLAGKRFDMVWVWLAHTKLTEDFLQFLTEVAPCRVGFLMESMTYEPGASSDLQAREAIVLAQAKWMTHVAVVDEMDVARIETVAQRPAFWWPMSVPLRFIREEPMPSQSPKAVFIGSVYEKRKDWFEHERLKGLLHHAPSPEDGTNLPQHFERVQVQALEYLQHSIPRTTKALDTHASLLRSVRTEIFRKWMETLSHSAVNVNLPSLCQCYPSRVVEGLASGRPMVSSVVPNRPKNGSLFAAGEEILLFQEKEELAAHLERLSHDEVFARELSRRALANVRANHSTEERVRRFCDWMVRSGN